MASPVDHTPRTTSQPDPRKLAKGIPDIRRLVPDPNSPSEARRPKKHFAIRVHPRPSAAKFLCPPSQRTPHK